MIARVKEYGSWITIAFFFAGVSGYLTSVVIDRFLTVPPVHFRLLGVTTPVVRAGDDAKFVLEVNRTKTCPAEIAGFWVSDHTIHRLPMIRGGASRPGVQNITYNIQTAGKDSDGDPFRLTMGTWEYFAVARHYCERDIYQTESPRVSIQIVE